MTHIGVYSYIVRVWRAKIKLTTWEGWKMRTGSAFISQKKIKEYKKMVKLQLHNQKWHDYMNTKKSDAIGWALRYKDPGDIISDIQSQAIKYYETQLMHAMCKK